MYVCIYLESNYSLKIKHLQKAGSAFWGALILVKDKRLGMKLYYFLWEKYNLPWEQRGGSEKPPRKEGTSLKRREKMLVLGFHELLKCSQC